MKQTAVEFLIEQISSSKYFYNLMEEIESRSTTVQPNVLQQAKAMEKEQMKMFYQEADSYSCTCYKSPTDEDFEQYYNENFKK